MPQMSPEEESAGTTPVSLTTPGTPENTETHEALNATRSNTALAERVPQTAFSQPTSNEYSTPAEEYWSRSFFDPEAPLPDLPRPTLRERYREWRERHFPYALHERSPRARRQVRAAWKPVIAAIMAILVLAGAGVAAKHIATAAAGKSVHLPVAHIKVASAPNGEIIHQPLGQAQPTPQTPTYTTGIWLSDANPPANGPVTIYVRVTHISTPEPGAVVKLHIDFPNGTSQDLGPSVTDAYGLTSFDVLLQNVVTTLKPPPSLPSFSATPDPNAAFDHAHPVVATATMTLNGATSTGTITFLTQ